MKQLRFQTGVHHHQQFVTGILHIEQVGHLGNGIYVVANRPKFRIKSGESETTPNIRDSKRRLLRALNT